jgi:hypothetical protein
MTPAAGTVETVAYRVGVRIRGAAVAHPVWASLVVLVALVVTAGTLALVLAGYALVWPVLVWRRRRRHVCGSGVVLASDDV